MGASTSLAKTGRAPGPLPHRPRAPTLAPRNIFQKKKTRLGAAAPGTPVYNLILVQYAIPYDTVVPFSLFEANATAITAFATAWRTVNNGGGVTSLALHFDVPVPGYGKAPSYTTNIQGVVDVLTGVAAQARGIPLGNPQNVDRLGLHVVMENDSGWAVQPYTMLSPTGYAAMSDPKTTLPKLPSVASEDPEAPQSCWLVQGGLPVSTDVPWAHPASYFFNPATVGMQQPTAFGGYNPALEPTDTDRAAFQAFAPPVFNGMNRCPAKGGEACYATVVPDGSVNPWFPSQHVPSEYSPSHGWPVGCPSNMSRCAWYMMLVNRMIHAVDPALKKVTFIVFDNEFENPPDGWACILYQYIAAMVQFGATREDLLPSGSKWTILINRKAADNDDIFLDPNSGTAKGTPCSMFWAMDTGVDGLKFQDVLEVHAAGEQYWMQNTGQWLVGNESVGGDIGNLEGARQGGVAPWLADKGYVGCTQSAADKPGADFQCGCRDTIYNTLSGPDPANVDKLLGNCGLGPLYQFIDNQGAYNKGCPTFSIEQLGPATSAIEFADPGCLGTLNFCGQTGAYCLQSSQCASKCGVANIFGTWTLDNFGAFLDKFAGRFNIAGNPAAPGLMIYDAAFLPLPWIQQVVDKATYAQLLALQAAAVPCTVVPPGLAASTCTAALAAYPSHFAASGDSLPYCGACPTPVPASAIGLECESPLDQQSQGLDCQCACPCRQTGCPKWGQPQPLSAACAGVPDPSATPGFDPATAVYCNNDARKAFGVPDAPLAGPDTCWCVEYLITDVSKCTFVTPGGGNCKCPCACGASTVLAPSTGISLEPPHIVSDHVSKFVPPSPPDTSSDGLLPPGLLPPMFIRRKISIASGGACPPDFQRLGDVCIETSCATVPMPSSDPAQFRPKDALYCTDAAAEYYHVDNPKVVGSTADSGSNECWCVSGPCTGSTQCGSQPINMPASTQMASGAASALSTPALIGVCVAAGVLVIVACVLAGIYGRRKASTGRRR